MKNDLRRKWICLFCTCIAFVCFGGQFASAADLVSGHYSSSSGKSIALSLNIQSPAPASLIIEQYLPPGTEILSSKPKYKKYNRKQGKVKWLLKNVRSGKMTITLHLGNPVGQGSVQALLRCKDPTTGKFIEKNILP
jgi:hypothetical protein